MATNGKTDVLDNGQKIKKYSISKEQRQTIQNIQNVLGIIRLEREGLQHSILLEITKARKDLSISADAPDGYERIVDFDPETYEVLVIDVPHNAIVKENVAKTN